MIVHKGQCLAKIYHCLYISLFLLSCSLSPRLACAEGSENKESEDKESKTPKVNMIKEIKEDNLERTDRAFSSKQKITNEESTDLQSLSHEEVIVRSSKDPSVSSTIVEVSSVSVRDQLESLGAWGVSTGGVGGRLEVQVRGGGGHQNGLYLDDIPLHSLRSKAIDLNLFAIDLLERVELTQGGSGALGGSGAMSGALRLQVPQPSEMTLKQRLKVSGGTQGFAQMSALTSASISPQLKSLFAFSLSGGPNRFSYRDQYGFSKRRKYSSFSRLTGLSKLDGELSEWSISTLIGAGRLDRGEPGPEPLSIPGRRSDQRARFLSLTMRSPHWLIGDAHLTLKLHQSLLSLRYLFREENPLWQSQQNAESDFQDLRILSSAALSCQWSSATASLYTEISETSATVNERDVTRWQGAVSPRLKWALSPYFDWRAAYRLDLNNERDPQSVPTSSLEWHTLGIRPWRIWLGGSLVWRDPGFDERYLNGPGLIPNPNLKPEKGHWAELGMRKSHKWRWRPLSLKLSTSFKLYSQRYQQLIIYVPIDPYRLRAENLTGAYLNGVESKLNLSLRRGQLKGGLDLVVSRIKHEMLEAPRSPLPLRPQRFGSLTLSLSKRLSRGLVKGWLSVVNRGAVTTDRFGERALPGRSLYSIGLTRYWRREWRWYLTTRLANLFNISSYDFALHPIAGRSFWLAFGVDR